MTAAVERQRRSRMQRRGTKLVRVRFCEVCNALIVSSCNGRPRGTCSNAHRVKFARSRELE